MNLAFFGPPGAAAIPDPGMRVTAGTVLGMLAAGHSREELLELYPYIEDADITACLEYATYRAQERELPIYATPQ